MRIAIVTDWLVTYAGAEKVLSEMIACFPNADLFSIIDFFTPESRTLINNKFAKTTFIQQLPFAKKFYRYYLPWMPLAIEQLDVSQYDIVISNSHALAKGVITGPDQLHISCILSPMRYAWDLQHQYLTESGLNHGLKGWFAKHILHKMRIWDQRTANSVDHYIAISNFIARRVKKYYQRHADIIYPPVDTNQFRPDGPKEDYYIAISRLVPYKKMPLIVEAFANMPNKRLLVIGSGPDLQKVQAKATSNVTLLGFQPIEQLTHYLQRAKALIFAAEEDFGITVLEAQASGTPVIAYGKGGALETVRGIDSDKPTGLFFYEQTVTAIQDAVHTFEQNQAKFTLENLTANAARFATPVFREKFKQFVLEKYQQSKRQESLCASD